MTIDAFAIHAEGGLMITISEISNDRSGEAALPRPVDTDRRIWAGNVDSVATGARGGELCFFAAASQPPDPLPLFEAVNS